MSKEETAPSLSWVQGPPFVQGNRIRDVSDPTAIRHELLLCFHVFKFIQVKLGKFPLLVARELELGPAQGLSHVLLVLQLGEDGHILLMPMTRKGWHPTWMWRPSLPCFHHGIVGTNPGSLQGFGGELLILTWHHVATEWELIHFCLLPLQVKDVDLTIRDTLAEGRLWVRLVSTISIIRGGAVAHGDTRISSGEPKGKGWDLLWFLYT